MAADAAGVHSEPRPRGSSNRPVRVARVRPDAGAGRARRGEDQPSRAGPKWGTAPTTSVKSSSRSSSAASSARGCTTCSPATTGTPRASSARTRSGRAVSRSGAWSPAAPSPLSSCSGQTPRHACGCGRDRARARGGAGHRPVGATTSTRSCSDGRRTCRGAWNRSRGPAGRLPAATRSTRRSSTSRCGASSSLGHHPLSRTQAGLRRGQALALYVRMYTFGRVSSRRCASIRPRGLRHTLQPAAFSRRSASAPRSGSCGSAARTATGESMYHRFPRAPDDADAQGERMTTTSPPATTVAARAEQRTKIYGAGEAAVHALDGINVEFDAASTSPRSWARPAPGSRRCCTASPGSTA